MRHIVIIGNGISGVTAARHLRKQSDFKITIISGETEHFFSRTALMYVFMGHMRYENIKPYEDEFWEKNRIDLIFGWVEKVDASASELKLADGSIVKYDELIIATGSVPNKFGWKGQDLIGVQGLYSWQDLELLEENVKRTERAVIVGGGLIGVELAEMLKTRNIEVTFLVREGRFWGGILPKEEGQLISDHIQSNGVNIEFNTELEEVIDDGKGQVKAIKTKDGRIIQCELLGLTVGVHPNVSFLKDSEIKINKGVLVDHFLRTNISNVYAIGDCAEFYRHPTDRKNIEQVWYTGKMMGETVAQTISGNETAYQPGVWFNSAKFFEIEYQTYGWVWNKPKENETVFCWQQKGKDRMVKLVFDKNTNALLGINTFGIRLRHEVCNAWIENRTSIDTVIQNFGGANFDPEFFAPFEQELLDQYNQQFNKNLVLKMKKSGRIANLLSKILNS
ncbi:NAD(P)/FAD-dependent oxidoreductase [Acidiluteibacter ferrifornacis]|uniref:FAD-dependent oxidoreductase n=1 Tax=Acidiluteibacter ferrifornacis TaxID=2692424 RepID=A0A6N9NHX4_9FLAO|nr:FAD/NAD(P)-binding oxidoreductase [Acidiluteibacter ferrifornacis]NBG64810.1 FAD-dependent oxidoreductase [Acidiluteibacter ferrifornacis]